MSQSAIKYYVIPGVVALIIITILLLIPINKKKSEENITPEPTISIVLPTNKPLSTPNEENVTPTLIPPQTFTGADINQELPQELKTVGEQKTALRRLTPLTLPFGVIEFDYENDRFLVSFSKQDDQNLTQFTAWREQNYPALTQDKFAFR